MKHILLTIAIIAMALNAFAQSAGTSARQTDTVSLSADNTTDDDQTSNPLSLTTYFIGYLSYDSALVAMPGYAMAQQQLTELRAQYDAEQQRVEQDFNAKYEEFLEGQHEFPLTILRKRQTELKELMERNVAFKAEVRQELKKAEDAAMAPLKTHLNEVIATVAKDHGLAVILNTDSNACPYLDPELSIDISQLVADILAKENQPKLTRRRR